MFKQLIIILSLISTCISGFSQTTDLLISEYVEGSFNNKYIEIYNGTGAAVNLTDYRLRLYSNGATTPTNDVLLSGTLADNSVIVYENSAAFAYGGAATTSTAANFNGDDAIVIYKISTASIVDIFGNIGCDPGASWSSGTFTTANKTLVRNADICSGVTSDPTNTSCPFPTLSTEWTQLNQDDVSNLGSHTNTCNAGCTPASEPTTNATGYSFSNIGCNGLTISWTSPNDSSLVVIKAGSDVTTDPVDGNTYSANTSFGSGDDIGTSEFVVYNGSGSSVIITGLSASTTYFINIFDYNGKSTCVNYRVSDEVSDNQATITCTDCPYIVSALINSCDMDTCTEGDNELFFLNSSDYYVSTAAADITLNYGSTFPASTTYADAFISNSTAVNNMNADIGCTGTFIDASTVSHIPPNSTFLFMNETVCADAFDWASICSALSGNVYVMFTSDATWNSFGQFSNSPPATGRHFRTIMGGCTVDHTYNDNLPAGDGAFATWDTGGGTATHGTGGCALPTTILPISLASFKVKEYNSGNLLEWSTSSEINNDYFTLERSTDANYFTEIGIVNGAGNSVTLLHYNFIDETLNSGINYYRLKQTDFNGYFSYSNTIALNNKIIGAKVYISNNSLKINLNKEISTGNLKIIDALGRTVFTENISKSQSISLEKFVTGIYLIRIETPTNSIVKKVKL